MIQKDGESVHCSGASLNRRDALRSLVLSGFALSGISCGANSVEHGDKETTVVETGAAQSPIALTHASCSFRRNSHLLSVSYDRPVLGVERSEHGLKMIVARGNSLLIDSKHYELEQIHFHTPSEHTIDGKPAPGELHFVHKDHEGTLAVVGLLVREGKENSQYATIFDSIPDRVGAKGLCKSRCNPAQLLPRSLNAFLYEGSLTTPPYSEGVQWMVLEESIEMSGPSTGENSQLCQLEKILGDNHRPTQPVNGRRIELIGNDN